MLKTGISPGMSRENEIRNRLPKYIKNESYTQLLLYIKLLETSLISAHCTTAATATATNNNNMD